MGLGALFPFHGNLQENIFTNSKRTKIASCQILTKIAEQKMKDLNAIDLQGAVQMVRGSARSMGLEVVEG